MRKKFACSPIRIENTPDVLCMAGNKNKFLFAECVAECFWTSSNFKNDPQMRLSSGSFKTKTEPKTCLRNLDPSALDASHHFIRYSSPSLASGEDRYTASPMTNRTGLKSTSVWLIDQFCRVNLFSFFLELMISHDRNGKRSFVFIGRINMTFFFLNPWDESNWKHYRLVSDVSGFFFDIDKRIGFIENRIYWNIYIYNL